MREQDEKTLSNAVHDLGQMLMVVERDTLSPYATFTMLIGIGNELQHIAKQVLLKADALESGKEQKKATPASVAEDRKWEKAEREQQEPPKKRSRKKKEEAVEEPVEEEIGELAELPTEEEAVADAAGATVEEVVEAWDDRDEIVVSGFEIVPPGSDPAGLDPRIGRLVALDGVTTEFLNANHVSPLLVANTVGKKGKHPFFQGPAAYMWYLPEERRRHYMADMMNYDKGYATVGDFCDIDKQREAWEKEGVDIDFVTSLLTKDEAPTYTSAPKRKDEPEVAQKVKAIGGFKKIVENLGADGEPLLLFMTRFGINQQVLVDLLTVVKAHKENRNPYIGG